MSLSELDKSNLLEIAKMCANGNDTLLLSGLKEEFQLLVAKLLDNFQANDGNIAFGTDNEGLLKIIHGETDTYISVITPSDGVGRNYLN